MKVSSRLALFALLLPTLARAQASTEEQLKRAVDMYNGFNIEGARPILLNIISPNNLLSVSAEQKVKALKYLGASYAVLDRADSAVYFFTAALDYDPFTDLDPQEFSAAELSAFSRAKEQIFKVAIKPITPRIIDTTYAFRLITTHRSQLKVELVPQTPDSNSRREVLFQSDNDGPRELPWRGLLRSGQRADSGLYELRASGQSARTNVATSDRQLFRIEHVYEPLEDTLPAFAANDTLPTEYRPMAPWQDLITGSVLGLTAIALPVVALDQDVKYTAHAATAGLVGFSSAMIAFSYRRGHRTIPQNVAENSRRKAQRAAFNAGVETRNRARLNATILLICPPTGCPR